MDEMDCGITCLAMIGGFYDLQVPFKLSEIMPVRLSKLLI